VANELTEMMRAKKGTGNGRRSKIVCGKCVCRADGWLVDGDFGADGDYAGGTGMGEEGQCEGRWAFNGEIGGGGGGGGVVFGCRIA